jgi:drug/metabolite transporter (DMT)-like permease
VTTVAVQAGALATISLAWLFQGGLVSIRDVAWALVAGAGMGVGTALLYRGLARGAMGVVAPVSALSAALVPLAVGLALGERPGLWAMLGIAAALPAIWLVASDPTEGGFSSAGVTDGLWSGIGFGVAFVALGQRTPDAGLAPLVIVQLVSIPPVVLLARVMGAKSIPQTRSAWSAAWIGPLGAGANVAFVWAVQIGQLTVTSVVASLYPAATVALATALLREPLRRHQVVGLALAGFAVGLISLP